MPRFLLAVISLLALICPAYGRLIPRGSDLPVKIEHSDVVALVDVLNVVGTWQPATAVNEYAIIRVNKIIKGNAPREIIFVTRGFMQATDPDCCIVGEQYLVFMKRGYPVFDTINGIDVIVLRERNVYMSPADGAYSTYRVKNDRVCGWFIGGKSGCYDLSDVISQIRNEIGS